MMEYFVGMGLAAGVAALAAFAGLDRDRAFYPAVLAVIASYYDLFAVMGGSAEAIVVEASIAALFLGVALIGFRTSLWLVVVALAGHGLLDLVHGKFVVNPGVPAWWPGFCLSYDLVAAGALAWRLGGSRHYGGTGPSIASRIDAERLAARSFELAGDPALAFRHLERAHVLSQAPTRQHVRVHIAMLGWSLRSHDGREAIGQVLRIAGAAVLTPFGLVPRGNPGGSNISPFQRLPAPGEPAGAAVSVSKSRKPVMAVLLGFGLLLYGNASCSAADKVRTAQVDGQTVAYNVLGSGKPTVVFISGLGNGMDTFKDVAPEIARTATVVVYDRAGYGGSARPDGPRDAVGVDRELLDLLAASGAPGPYILAGHSNGGLYAEYFAARHPELVAGLILEESRPADFGRRCQAARLGPCTPTLEMVKNAPAGEQAEVASLEGAFAQVEAVTPVAGKPVLVLSRPIRPNPRAFDRLWGQGQDDLAARYPGSTHLRAPGGGHYIHKDQKAWFVTSVRDWIQKAGATASP